MKNIVTFLSILLMGSLLLAANRISLWASPSPAPAPADSCPYTVKKGDTLIKIAAHLTGSSKNYPLIMQFNGLTSDLIAPGAVLHIPQHLLLEEFQCVPLTTPLPTPFPTMTPSPVPTPTPVSTATPLPTLTPPPRKGKKILAEIEGLVFEDTNGNNEPDPGEPGIQGVKVILVKGRIDQPPLTGIIGITDENGKFLFTNVEPGPRAVGLYETTLPHEAALLTESTIVVNVAEGGKSYIKFAIQNNAKDSL